MNNQETAQQLQSETRPTAQAEHPPAAQSAQIEDLPATQTEQDEVKGGLVASARDANLFS